MMNFHQEIINKDSCKNNLTYNLHDFLVDKENPLI